MTKIVRLYTRPKNHPHIDSNGRITKSRGCQNQRPVSKRKRRNKRSSFRLPKPRLLMRFILLLVPSIMPFDSGEIMVSSSAFSRVINVFAIVETVPLFSLDDLPKNRSLSNEPILEEYIKSYSKNPSNNER